HDSDRHSLAFASLSADQHIRTAVRDRDRRPVPRRAPALRLPARPRRTAPPPPPAADGKRPRAPAPNPETARVVKRIFAEYLAGRGLKAIAEGLTHDDIPSPSAYDPGRNSHRCGIAWSYSAVRAILANPRYTGRQVWNKQPKSQRL